MFQQPRTRFATSDPRDRAAPRLKLFEPATLDAGGAAQRIHLLDISISGALAHAAAPPARAATVRVAVRGFDLVAAVMWVRGKRFGIAFALPLHETTLRAIVEGATG